jgi:hypothetical protein
MFLTSPDPQQAEPLGLWLDELAAAPGAFSAMLRRAFGIITRFVGSSPIYFPPKASS